MTMLIQKNKSLDAFNVNVNEISVKALFKKYEDIGFIYPKKKALLKPHFDQITKHWQTLLQSKENLLWILTNAQNTKENFASISVIKQSNYGLLAQHLVSDGNPFLSLKVMLAAQFKAEHHYDENEVRSSQNWFRPDNRYAYRIFASMFKKLGDERASLIPFHYLHLKLDKIQASSSANYSVEKVVQPKADFIDFVSKEHGKVFLQAEELDGSDIELSKLGAKYKNHGLNRSRKVWSFKNRQTGKVIAAVVANRAPIGLNFSLLENRAYYILDRQLDSEERKAILALMNHTVKAYYEDFEQQAIPIVTDEKSAEALESLGADFLRKYMQSIWMRAGFPLWYEHIFSFLQRIEKRIK